MQIPSQLGTNKEDLDITREEFKKIEKAMKKPEFADLMGDYMKEISDPKNREEYDQYLRQLEKDQELPKGMKLVKPEPHFCLKTSIWNKQNRKHEQKFFINICSSGVIDQPSFDIVEQNGQRGQNWKIPYSIGKIRYDQDKKGTICNTVDVAFHPYTIGNCHKIAGFQALVFSTAVDASQKQLGERQEDISKDYKVLKKKCKGSEPALLPVRIGKKGKMTNELDSRQGGQANAQTKLQKEITELKQQAQENDQKEQQTQAELEAGEEDEQTKESDEINSVAVQQPKYRFIYSYPVDYSDFIDQAYSGKKYPNTLGCDIKLPRVQNFQEIQLDVSASGLVLDVATKYYLDIKLPYPVETGRIEAKFDKKVKTLKLRVPISKEYLQQKYQEEVEEIRKKSNQLKEDFQEDEFEVKFIPADQSRPLVEEINAQTAEPENQIEAEVEQRIEYKAISLHTRYLDEHMFFILQVKGYKEDRLKLAFNSSELLIFDQEETKELKTLSFIHLVFNSAQSKPVIQYMTDFIVAKYPSASEIDHQVVDYSSTPFTQFMERLDQITLSKQEEEMEITYEKESQQSSNSTTQPKPRQIELIQKDDEDDYQAEANAEQNGAHAANDRHEQKSSALEQAEELVLKAEPKKNIQFIFVQDLLPDIYEID